MSALSTLNAIEAIAVTLGSIGAVIIFVRGIPWAMAILLDRAKLIAKIEQVEHERDSFQRALNATIEANAGWQLSFDGLSSQVAAAREEVRAVTTELDALKRKWLIGIEYIAALVAHHDSKGKACDLPPLPKELRDDVAAFQQRNEDAI